MRRLVPKQITLLLGLAINCCPAPPVSAEGPADFIIQARVDDRLIEGQPLSWDDSRMLLLARDGRLHEFDLAKAEEAKRTGKRFVAYSPNELRGRLRAEYGEAYDISLTGHFVVVHPKGTGNQWANRLESLYRSFIHYMSVRGFSPSEPSAPLVAIVFRNELDFHRDAMASGKRLHPDTLGFYDLESNRVHLFDTSELYGSWQLNAETIVHEAVHQTAYNVGVHHRFAEQPRWLVEGLAMMFEAPGVWDAASAKLLSDRINGDRLAHFRETNKKRRSDWITRLVVDDRAFRGDALSAYSEAWALSFFLCETRPRDYCAFLSRTADRKPFSEYSSLERLTDFTAHFGRDLEQLEAQLQRWVAELP